MVEWSATTALAASVGALPVLIAWSIAYRFPTLAASLCILPLAAAVLVTRASRPRHAAYRSNVRHGQTDAGGTPSPRTAPALRWLVAGVLVTIFAGGLAGVLWGAYVYMPRAVWLLHVAASAMAGAVTASLCRPDAMQTAQRLDERLGLRERMSTSAALLSHRRRDAVAEAVVSQTATMAERGARTVSMWTLGRGTAGALCLSVMACLVLLLTPVYGPARIARTLDGLGARAAEMSPADLERLADQLRSTAATDADGTRQLHAAATAADAGDKELLAQSLALLAQLIEDGKIRLIKTPPALADGTLLDELGTGDATGNQQANANAMDNPANPANNVANPATDPPTGQPLATTAADTVAPDQTQLVFHPDYARLTTVASGSTPNATAKPSATYAPFDQAWSQARARASQSLADGEIPSNRRQVVQEFFRTP